MTSTQSRSKAAQEPIDQREKWEFMIGVSIFLAIVIGLVFGSYQLLRIITDEQQVPLEGLILQGELVHTATDDIRAAILAGEVGSFFTADVDDIRERIEALPWVFSASIRKEWPGRLRVYVVEQDPVAIWNDRAVMNGQGHVFAADPSALVGELPALYGPEHAHKDVLEQFRQMRDLLRIADMEITRVELSERYSVRVWLAQDIELRLGREARLERIQRFMDLYPLIQDESDKPVKYADLRYDTGIAVGWRSESK
ncbi:cell division protein FtsQ/DivIB [Aliidiomarina sanyensis]|uniref:Cell division protein FtsQ n=1 Tax=Aliidiomarina sanyensis TaxID=1249555 RepID=A0A432WI94_9GAMM|nr:cell division protein FtsQ/DivIB [Aliidiomarina sanyensis]RUO33488.1 cell division protein DivIVA [Aliidiomarina sanyensis]